jgi:hypothetical protein
MQQQGAGANLCNNREQGPKSWSSDKQGDRHVAAGRRRSGSESILCNSRGHMIWGHITQKPGAERPDPKTISCDSRGHIILGHIMEQQGPQRPCPVKQLNAERRTGQNQQRA